MIKTKLFKINKTSEPEGNAEINQWLAQKSNISIISTNTFSNIAGWGYIILYTEIEETHE